MQLPAGQLIQQVQHQLPLGPVVDVLGQVAGRAPAGHRSLVPALGHKQPPVQRAGGLPGDRVDRHPQLAVGPLAQRARVLPLDPTEQGPSLGKPVSSTTHAAGESAPTSRSASRWRTGRQSQGLAAMKWCSAWSWTSPSWAAIGWIDLRRPSNISPRR